MIRMLVLAAVAFGLAFVLNPGPERHRDRLKAEVAARSPVAGALKLGHVAAFVTQYHTLGVASYTTIGDRTVTVGAFGFVFVPDFGAR